MVLLSKLTSYLGHFSNRIGGARWKTQLVVVVGSAQPLRRQKQQHCRSGCGGRAAAVAGCCGGGRAPWLNRMGPRRGWMKPAEQWRNWCCCRCCIGAAGGGGWLKTVFAQPRGIFLSALLPRQWEARSWQWLRRRICSSQNWSLHLDPGIWWQLCRMPLLLPPRSLQHKYKTKVNYYECFKCHCI